MKVLIEAIQSVMDMGAVIMLPILLTIVGLVFRLPFSRALRAGVTVGIGFAGISMVVNYLVGIMAPAAEALGSGASGKFGGLTDLGWVTEAAAIWAAPFAIICVPLIFVVNVLLILAGYTKTLNVDVWNFMHTIGAAAVVYFATGGNYILAIALS